MEESTYQPLPDGLWAKLTPDEAAWLIALLSREARASGLSKGLKWACEKLHEELRARTTP